jgi:hypothetical protein
LSGRRADKHDRQYRQHRRQQTVCVVPFLIQRTAEIVGQRPTSLD